jgi:gliding motility-associated-like protein
MKISEQTLLQLETVLIPEGFSPNGDNVNDTWHISGIDQYPVNHVEVYSRWETKVFETDNYGTNNEWNGIPNVLNGLSSWKQQCSRRNLFLHYYFRW